MIKEIGEIDFSGLSTQGVVAMVIIIVVVFMVLIVSILIWATHQIINPLWDNNTNECFLVDYKEIIDRITKEKRE